MTIAEEESLNLVFVHYELGWRLAKSTDYSDLKPLAIDARHFFSLPLPRAVWEKTKQYRNQKFVRFITRAIGFRRAILMKFLKKQAAAVSILNGAWERFHVPAVWPLECENKKHTCICFKKWQPE